ncbi:DUF2867 domain-containing protein [Pseudodesulfovibrio cashew]|uniref:DUF2867 domain-containing protein n=1 Tax=Pseudodesulfovibrio cashew TaxID=2678688 RepID=A0A6I6JJ97_9BACT|nr:DUF2867 domain-containing protein [Pseudodesulfovibrio cashew]QGY41028.1 DUF2867 domain-containing protein [Pseudodesulfovibrio cashew]
MSDSSASMRYLSSLPELEPLFQGADHMDVKTIESNKALREFLAGLISYSPSWLQLLYRVRGMFVRLLGMRQEPMENPKLSPEEISFTPGDSFGFFTVTHGKEASFLAAMSEDKHLSAHILIAAEPLENGLNRFYAGTVVRYKHWTGPVYFNIIRPFHHLVVHFMIRHAVA